ncbi:MAG: arginine--tRNA ligase [Ilumatobacteraceae bacterium]
MADPLVTVAQLLAPAFARVAGADADPVVRPSDRADAQANGALAVAKALGRNPREVATEVAAIAAAELDRIATLEVAGPGFINVTFADDFIAGQVVVAAADDRLGVRASPAPETVVVDYSAPNVAKEMHVGHLRTTVIGDSIVRLLDFLGHRVIRENHIGDWGTPFGMLIEHLVDGGADATSVIVNDDPNVFYQAARAKFDSNDDFKERARERVVKLQAYDPETIALWQQLVDASTEYFNLIYGELGILLTDDDLMGESAYQPLLPQVIERLRDGGLLQESDGAEVVFPPGYTNRDGDPLPLIVHKGGAGGFNYATSDLACVIDRVERLHATLLLYVVGAPQAQHLSMVFDVAQMAGWLQPPTRAVHVAFGNMLGADRKMFKTRSGESVKLQELITEAIERGVASVADKNPELEIDERERVGRMIGIGAMKYADLSSDRIKDYVFDWDRMLAFEGNTGPYLQYAHARIRSIFRRAEVSAEAVRDIVPILGTPAERALALKLLSFDGAVQETAERFTPHRLCTYLFELAQEFSAFYEACPVLRAETDELRLSRLALADHTARVLAQGLSLLGIDAPERM